MDVRVKTIPQHFEVGKQLILEWDIVYNLIEGTKMSYLYFENIEVANSFLYMDHDIALHRLIGNRANVSITYNQIIVTIEKLEPTDVFEFTGIAVAGEYNEMPFTSNKSIIIKATPGIIKIKTARSCTAGFNFECTIVQH